MNQRSLKRVVIGAGVVVASGLALIGYSFMAKSVDAFAIGGVIALAGLQCGMNAHLALLRSGRSI